MVVQLDYKKGVFFEFISQYLHRIKYLTKIFDKAWLNRHCHWTCTCGYFIVETSVGLEQLIPTDFLGKNMTKSQSKNLAKMDTVIGFAMEKYTLVPSLVQGYLL